MGTVIAVANSKGGVGKTTTSVNLADAFHLEGKSTLLIDHDHLQHTASDWRRQADIAKTDTCNVVLVDSDLQRFVQEMRGIYDIVVVDAPPRMTTAESTLVAIADLVVIPIQPNQADVWAAITIIDAIINRQMITGGNPEALFLFTRAILSSRQVEEAVELLGEFRLPIAKTVISQRVDYARSLGYGTSVARLGKTNLARKEFNDVFQEIKKHVGN